MYALIEIAGKQYKIEDGVSITVPRLEGEIGTVHSIDKVLYLEENGNYTSISDGDSYAFNIDDSGINHFSLYIGNIVPQAPQGVLASGGDRQIAITGSSDGGDLNEIRNR